MDIYLRERPLPMVRPKGPMAAIKHTFLRLDDFAPIN